MGRQKASPRIGFPAFIRKLAKQLGYEFRGNARGGVLELPNGSLSKIYFKATACTVFVYVSVRTSSWGFDGERTDLHDGYSICLACFLRTLPPYVSPLLWDVFNPLGACLETELYGRYLTFAQPSGSTYNLDSAGQTELTEIVGAIRFFEAMVPRVTTWSLALREDQQAILYQHKTPALDRWIRAVRKALDGPDPKLTQAAFRRNPHWMHFRRIEPVVSVLQDERMAAGLRALVAAAKTWETVETTEGLFVVSGSTENVVPAELRKRAVALVAQLPGEKPAGKVSFIPLENHCVVLGKRHVVCLQAMCGQTEFQAMREHLRAKHERVGAILFRQSEVLLGPTPNDEEFEEMVTLLLQREPNVLWARKVGHAREADGGKDILAEWDLPSMATGKIAENCIPQFRRKVVVQCKATQRPVGKANVRDIRDLLEHNEASGFLLVVSSRLTVGLIEQLTKLRASHDFWADWWTCREIETKLERNLDIARKYPRFISVRPSRGK